MFRVTVLLVLISVVLVIGARAGKGDVDTDRILGGSTLLIQDLPCLVSLQRRGVHICGGFIFAENIIISAAHCILGLKPEQTTVRAGSTLWSSGGQVVGVKKIIKHNQYDTETKNYDIAIIILDKPLEFERTVRACEISTKVPRDGQNCLIAGWGLKKENADMIPNMCQKANVTTISREKCSSPEFEYHTDILGTMMCANNHGIDACQGDSGGPLVCGNKVAAVTSFGKGCGRKEYPGVYTSLASVPKWIAKNT